MNKDLKVVKGGAAENNTVIRLYASKDLVKRFKALYPDRGAMSVTLRNLLRRHVEIVEQSRLVSEEVENVAIEGAAGLGVKGDRKLFG